MNFLHFCYGMMMRFLLESCIIYVCNIKTKMKS